MDHSGKVLLMAFFGSYIGRCLTSQKWPVIDESERRKAFHATVHFGPNSWFPLLNSYLAIMAVFAIIQRLHKGKISDLQRSTDLEIGAFEKSKETLDKNDGLPAYTDIVKEISAF